MKVAIIAAVSDNGVIGKDNELIWELPNDMEFFKNTTKGGVLIMGRKTYESIGKPLPERINIVVTRQSPYPAKHGYQSWESRSIITTGSLKEAMNFKYVSPVKGKDVNKDEMFIIGGGEIYKEAMGVADKIYLTKVHDKFKGDAYFPKIDLRKWKEVSRDYHETDEDHDTAYSFIVYERKVSKK